MPVGRRYDFQIAGKGFLLARGEYRGRAWQRTGRSDAPGQRSQADARYGVLPDEIDHPEVWDDWSGGFGYAYRKPETPNTYHWSENFDCRFPRQMVHCQAPQLVPRDTTCSPANTAIDAESFIDLPYQTGVIYITDGEGRENIREPGQGCVMVLGRGYAKTVFPMASGSVSPGVWGLPYFNASGSWAGGGLNYGYQAALFGEALAIPNLNGSGFSATYARSAGGETEYPPTLTSMPGRAFVGAGNRLWRAHGKSYDARYLQNAVTGWTDTASWTATLTIGVQQSAIKALVALEDQVFCGMNDGLYAGDASGTFFNVFTELAHQRHDDNCRDLAVYEGGIAAVHISGLRYYRTSGYSAEIVDINPVALQTGRTPLTGYIRAVRAFAPWLYAGVTTGSYSHLLAGRFGGAAGIIWHSLNRFPHLGRVHRMHFDGITRAHVASAPPQVPNRMWVGLNASINTSGTAPTYWWPIPYNNGNPLMPSLAFSPNYVGSARIDLGQVNWDAPGTPKLFRAVEVWADNLASAAQWANVYYTVDQEATRHLLGTTAKSPKDTLYFPSGEGSFVTGQAIELSLESFTASAGVTPVYRSIVLRGALQPRSVDLITAVVRIADGLRDRQGAEMRSGATMLQELRDFGNPDTNGKPHQLIDLAGAVNYVRVLGRVEEQENFQKGDDNPEIAATVRLAVLTFSGG